MYRNLGTLRDLLPEIPGATDVLEAIDGLDTSLLDRVHLLNWAFRETRAGLYGELALAFPGELTLALPNLEVLSFAFGANIPGYTTLYGSLLIGDPSRLNLYNLQVQVRLDHELLRPASLDPNEPAPDRLDITLQGSFRIDTDLNIEPRLDFFTVPPFEVGRTGVILALYECGFDLSEHTTPASVTALGYDASFRGMYARSAHFHWLPQLDLGGLKGLRLDFEHVVLGQGGVSFDLEASWQVAYDEHGFLPATELRGFLLNEDWEVALASVRGQVRQNVPSLLFAAGFVEVPILGTVFGVEFSLSRPDEDWTTLLRLFQDPDGPEANLQLGSGTLSIQQFDLAGTLQEEAFALEGQLRGQLLMPGFDLVVNLARTRLEHDPLRDLFQIELDGVAFGPLGEVEQARLRYEARQDPDTGNTEYSLLMTTSLYWQDIQERLHLDDLPEPFPLPPDDAELTAFLSWETAPSTRVVLRFSAEVPEPDALWRFVPQDFRPEVRGLAFRFEASYDDVAEFQQSGSESSFEGEIFAEMELRLPELPDAPGVELFQFETGDEDGWMQAKILAGSRPNPDTGDQEPYLDLELGHPLSVDLNLPGLPQPEPPIHVEITKVEADLTLAAATEGRFALTGDFRLRPLDPPPFLPLGEHLRQLLAPLETSDLAGSATLEIAFRDDRAALSLDATFADADIEVDVFDMIGGLAANAPGQAAASEGAEFPLDIDIGFGIRGVRMQLGSLEETSSEGLFSLEMVFRLSLAGLSTELYFLLSDRELSLGLAEGFDVPLRVPRFPLAPEDLQPFADSDGNWSTQRARDHIDSLYELIDALEPDGEDAGQRRLLAELQGQAFLLENILGIFEAVAPSGRGAYQTYVEFLVGVFHLTTNALHVDSDLKLVLSGRNQEDGGINPNGVKFVIPFADPRNIALQGAAYLDGFAEDDPFRVFEGLQLGLGLSTDMIFFSVDSLASPIELPKLGPYEGTTINLSRFRIGYGYTRNSFALDFAGSLILPEQLVEDADTSQLIGAGVRLPTHNALAFRLDIIPVSLGPANFVVPLFDFNLDLRRPNVPALLGTSQCTPYWDGLQLVVPGLYHDALKRVAFSPMFGPFVIPNFRFDGDVMIGDDRNGLTVIADNVLILLGVWVGSSALVGINFLAHPFEPYFDNFCVNLRLAGFRLNFNLQRPFPSPSPLALFEVLGLLSDPTMPIDPTGPLANTLRISLTDAYLHLPEPLAGLFPGQAGTIEKPIEATLNLGSLITAVQAGVKVGKEVTETLQDQAVDLDTRLRQLRNNPPELDLGALLAALPPELRKYRLSASLAGFEATVVLLLLDAGDLAGLREEMRRRGEGLPPYEPDEFILGVPPEPEAMARFRPNLAPLPGQGRVFHPGEAEENLFRGIEFEGFAEEDLEAIPLPDPAQGASGVVLGAHVRLFNGQRFRFLGFLFDNGAFSLVTSAEVEPLRLRVAGIETSIPFRGRGRLFLQGRQKRDGYYGAIRATGWGVWKVLPGVLRLEIASEKKPAELALFSDGRFRLNAGARLRLFRNVAKVEGAVQLSETHCLVRGAFEYAVGDLVGLTLEVEGRVGPGPRFRLAGSGSLSIAGLLLGLVRGEVSEDFAAVEGRLDTKAWPLGGVTVPGELEIMARGKIYLRPRQRLAFSLEGEGRLSFLGASIRGRGGLWQDGPVRTTWMEGALAWQGHDWLGARMEIGSAGLRLRGRAGFTLKLTPDGLAGTDLAHLFLHLDLSVDVSLDAAGGLAGFALRGNCTLGAKLPGASGQVFPLAVNDFDISGQVALELGLVHVAGFVLVPFRGVRVPMPTVSGKTPPSPVRFGENLGSPAISWAGTMVTLAGGVVPVVTPGNLPEDQTERKVYLAYDIDFDEDDYLDLDLPLDGEIDLSLVWWNKKLALRLRVSGQPDRHMGLDEVFGSSLF